MTETGSLNLTTTPIVVPLDQQSDASENVSYVNPNAITIVKAGTYLINVTLSGRAIPSGTAAAITLALAVNNVAQANTMQTQEFAAAELNSFVFSNYLTLAAGDRVSLLISADPNTLLSTPQTGQAAGLTVLRVS